MTLEDGDGWEDEEPEDEEPEDDGRIPDPILIPMLLGRTGGGPGSGQGCGCLTIAAIAAAAAVLLAALA
jgi:hypothetical protein